MSETIRNDDVLTAGNSLIYRAATSGVDTTGWSVERGEGPTGRRTWLLTSPRKITETANFIDLGFKNADAFERIRELYGELEEKGAEAFAPEVRITETERGFRVYGDPVRTRHGEEIRVYESSNAMGPHVWFASTNHHGTEVRIELSEDNARELVAQLRTWLHGIPERWSD